MRQEQKPSSAGSGEDQQARNFQRYTHGQPPEKSAATARVGDRQKTVPLDGRVTVISAPLTQDAGIASRKRRFPEGKGMTRAAIAGVDALAGWRPTIIDCRT